MNGTVQEWLLKAQEDFNAAQTLLNSESSPAYDVVCYLAQQSVEKTIKAVLIQNRQEFPKIHHLVRLAQLVQPFLPDWEIPIEDLDYLSDLGFRVRYPDEFADDEDAKQAMAVCTGLRQALLSYFSC